MATAHGVSSINLLPKTSFEFSTTGKALKWATTVGRVLVVLTEFVVLLAFASRFYFDKKLSDLSETLTQKEAQIAAYADVEAQMRKILAKETPIETAQKESLGFTTKFDGLAQIMPTGVTLDSLNLNKTGLTIMGKAQSEYSFAQLIAGIKKMPGVKTINMNDTSFDQTSAKVKFSMVISFK